MELIHRFQQLINRVWIISWVFKIQKLDFTKSEHYERLFMNIFQNIRFQQSVIEGSQKNIDDSIAKLINAINSLPNIEARERDGLLLMKNATKSGIGVGIDPRTYNSMGDLITDIINWKFYGRNYESTTFDHLQGLVQQLEDVQGLLKDQLQSIVNEIPNKNYQLSIEVCGSGIRLTHRLDMVETSCVIPACEITSKDELLARIDDFLDKI